MPYREGCEVRVVAFNAIRKSIHFHIPHHFLYIYIPTPHNRYTLYTTLAMLMSQIKHVLSARNVSSAVIISTGFKPLTTITQSFPTASSYSSVSKVWLKPSNIMPIAAAAAAATKTSKPAVFLETGKRFLSTITSSASSSACKEINMKSTVNDQEAKIESSINFPLSPAAESQPIIKNQSIKEENIEALNYVVIQMNSGRWNEEEKKKFKTKLMELSSCPPMGSTGFFRELAKAVGSRTVQQCKQHHGYHYRGML
ncbi:hypothetical protein MBANPS3_006185 [Mucor bainieri]